MVNVCVCRVKKVPACAEEGRGSVKAGIPSLTVFSHLSAMRWPMWRVNACGPSSLESPSWLWRLWFCWEDLALCSVQYLGSLFYWAVVTLMAIHASWSKDSAWQEWFCCFVCFYNSHLLRFCVSAPGDQSKSHASPSLRVRSHSSSWLERRLLWLRMAASS